MFKYISSDQVSVLLHALDTQQQPPSLSASLVEQPVEFGTAPNR